MLLLFSLFFDDTRACYSLLIVLCQTRLADSPPRIEDEQAPAETTPTGFIIFHSETGPQIFCLKSLAFYARQQYTKCL
jgi:hypothetical protein